MAQKDSKAIKNGLDELCKQFGKFKNDENCEKIVRRIIQEPSPDLPNKSDFTNLTSNYFCLDGMDTKKFTKFMFLYDQLQTCTNEYNRISIATFLLDLAASKYNSCMTKSSDEDKNVKYSIFDTKPKEHPYPNERHMNDDRLSFPHKPENPPWDKDRCNTIMEHIIYGLVGVETKFLKKDVITGKLKLDPKEKMLEEIEKSIIMRLVQVGNFYNEIKVFTDGKSGNCALGLMGQGFISGLNEQLTKYNGFVALIQSIFRAQKSLTAEEIIQKNVNALTPIILVHWMRMPYNRFFCLKLLAKDCQEKKGGQLLSCIYECFRHTGDPTCRSLMDNMLKFATDPLMYMLATWILDGEINDPFGEFFIESISEVQIDCLWYDKYRIRTKMIPSFLTTQFVQKVLVIGKNINFIKEISKNNITEIPDRKKMFTFITENSSCLFSGNGVDDTELHMMIDSLFLSTSKDLLDIIKNEHKLMEHLQAMKNYILLGQGDFVGILMTNLKSELDKPAKQLFWNDLHIKFEVAIRSTNSYQKYPQLLEHLDIRLLHPFEGDTGWDIISLSYSVKGSLSSILEPTMHLYNKIFKHLWKMKHIEFILMTKIWKEQMLSAKNLLMLRPILKPIMGCLHYYTAQMIHFIRQTEYYLFFEAVGNCWTEFHSEVLEAKTLDEILLAHKKCLEQIYIRAFLDESTIEISGGLEEVYLGILRLESWQDNFLNRCHSQAIEMRNYFDYKIKYDKQLLENETEENFIKITEKYEKRLQRFEIFVENRKHDLEKIGKDFEAAIRHLIFMLNSNGDTNIQSFGKRMDFNDYYKKRDQRIGVPLTFEHIRLNSNNSKTNITSMNISKIE